MASKIRRKRVRAMQPPNTYVRQYQAYLRKVIVAYNKKFVSELVIPRVRAIVERYGTARADSVNIDADALIREIRRLYNLKFDESELTKIAEQTQSLATSNLSGVLKDLGMSLENFGSVGGVAVKSLVQQFVSENTQLIVDVSDQFKNSVAKIVTREIAGGVRHEEIAKNILAVVDVSERRAELIARDQVLKVYGQTNAVRQKALGIREFVWRTAGDNRVRDEHEDRNGETYAYDSPPDGELPGEPILCRCYAEPVIDFDNIEL